MNEETAVSLSLVLRHSHNARNVIFLLTELLLGKVSNEVTSLAIVNGQNIEEERLYIVVKRLVIKKELGQQAEVLTIDLIDIAIHFKDRQVVFAVDFRGRWVSPKALGHVPIKDGTTLHVLEAKLAQEQFRQPRNEERIANLVDSESEGNNICTWHIPEGKATSTMSVCRISQIE